MRSIKSLEKGLQILELMSNFQDGVRAKDVTRALDEPISNVSLFLNSMVNVGFLSRDADTARYYFTQKLADIARKTERSMYAQLRSAALPEMTTLRDELNEAVLLSVLDGHDIHFIERLQPKRSVRIQQSAGMHYPPHVTAAGKAILAFLEPQQRDRYLAEALYHRFTEKSLVSPKSLEAELELVRAQGYAVNRGEYESEIMAVASPILVAGMPLASVVVQFPTFRYGSDDLPRFGKRISKCATAIEREVAGSQEATGSSLAAV